MRVLIVPDKFKGTLTAEQAAKAIAEGWRAERARDDLEILPMSDGGDGFGPVMARLMGAKTMGCHTIDAAHRSCNSKWWWEEKSKTAIIETAAVIGLAMLPRGKFHPFELDTYGVGALFAAAERRGAKSYLIGIGGSATNDGGFGLARALGWRFLNRQGQEISRWVELDALAEIRRPPRDRTRRPFKVRVAVDVQNKLVGAKGASRIYGPQKGLRARDMPQAEKCLRRLAQLTNRALRRDMASRPGSGAAGGLGFGLAAFMDAELEPGFELFARYAGLDNRLKRADLVITGEGSIDRSSLMGKGVGEVARKCRKLGIPCIGLGGKVQSSSVVRRGFTQTAAMTAMARLQEACERPAFWLSRVAAGVAKRRLETPVIA